MWRSDIFSLTPQRPSQDRLAPGGLALLRRVASNGPEVSHIRCLTLSTCKELRLLLYLDRLERQTCSQPNLTGSESLYRIRIVTEVGGCFDEW